MNPNLWKLEDSIKTSELNVRYFDFNNGAGAYDLAKMDVDTAKEELDKGQKDFAESLRNLYATVKETKKNTYNWKKACVRQKRPWSYHAKSGPEV